MANRLITWLFDEIKSPMPTKLTTSCPYSHHLLLYSRDIKKRSMLYRFQRIAPI